MSAATSSRPVPAPRGDGDPGQGQPQRPSARAEPRRPAHSPQPQRSPSLLPCPCSQMAPTTSRLGGQSPPGICCPAPTVLVFPTAHAGCTRQLGSLPSPSSHSSLFAHPTAVPCRVVSLHVCPVPLEPWPGTNISALPIPTSVAARGVWGSSPWRKRGPAFPCSRQVLPPCPVLPVTLGKKLLDEGTGGATSVPRDPSARLLPPRAGGGEGGTRRTSSLLLETARDGDRGRGGPSRTHRLPLPDRERCPSAVGTASAWYRWPGPSPFPLADEAAPDPIYSPAARKPSRRVSAGRGAAGRRDLRSGCAW